MPLPSLKSLHTYLRILENPAEMKRRMPPSTHQRSVREGMAEIGKLTEQDAEAFQRPESLAAVIGSQRFVMIWGEPSLNERVARVLDGTKVLVSVLIDPLRYDQTPSGQLGPASGGSMQASGMKGTGLGGIAMRGTSVNANVPTAEAPLDNLKPLLAGNQELTLRLFRALFEHMLGATPASTGQQGGALLVNDLTGNKEHGRSFLSTALFILGAPLGQRPLLDFMMEQGLFGIPVLEQLVQSHDYCEAFFGFRRQERAFIGSSVDEEARLRGRFNVLLSSLRLSADETSILGPTEQDRTRVAAHLAAMDVLESLALTPFRWSLEQAVGEDPGNCLRSVRILADLFELFGRRGETREQTNLAIGDHLLAFARQFSVSVRPGEEIVLDGVTTETREVEPLAPVPVD